MLAHAIEDTDFANLDAADFIAEWKWDGIRVQAVAGRDERGHMQARLYSRTGEDITRSFPDLLPSLHSARRDRRRIAGAARRPRADLQRAAAAAEPQGRLAETDRRSFRSTCAPTTCSATTRTICASCRSPSAARSSSASSGSWAIRASTCRRPIPFAELGRADGARAPIRPAPAPGEDAEAVEGVMLKRRDAPYVPGRPKGQWWKWKRDPHIIDAVLMYAQRGHGKRSSYYSDYTFGVWTTGEDGDATGAGRQGLFRLHRRGIAADRPLRPPQHHRESSARCATSCMSRTRAWCWKSPSRGWRARRGTNPASRCGFPASAGCAGTSRRARPTGWRRWSGCWRRRRRTSSGTEQA